MVPVFVLLKTGSVPVITRPSSWKRRRKQRLMGELERTYIPPGRGSRRRLIGGRMTAPKPLWLPSYLERGLKVDLDRIPRTDEENSLMDAARSVVPQTGVEAEDKQRRLIWDPTADAKQIPPSRHKMSPVSHASPPPPTPTYQRVQVDVGPLNLLGLPVVLHHGAAQDVQVLLQGGGGRPTRACPPVHHKRAA